MPPRKVQGLDDSLDSLVTSVTKACSFVSPPPPPHPEKMLPQEEGVFATSPRGQKLQVDLLSTWGDPYYVGLSALEVFDEKGDPVELADPHRQVRAEPADINVLPENGQDVRVAPSNKA